MDTLRVSNSNIHIPESYKVTNRDDMRTFLEDLACFYSHFDIFKQRSIGNMIREWRGHNFLYELGYKRERTGDVDIQIPYKWYEPIGYAVLSLFYTFVVKNSCNK